MRISDWSSDVCSSDLNFRQWAQCTGFSYCLLHREDSFGGAESILPYHLERHRGRSADRPSEIQQDILLPFGVTGWDSDSEGTHRRVSRRSGRRSSGQTRSAEHTSELQSLMRISYAVFCLKKNTHYNTKI